LTGLRVVEDGQIRRWTLQRPDARNALNHSLMDALLGAAADAAADPTCRVIVLDGAQPMFCSGSDVAELATLSTAEIVSHESRWPSLRDALAELDAPVIASVRGGAVGGGLVLMLYADVRIAEESAYFSLPEVELGWLPPGGIEELAADIGVARARRLVLLNSRVRAPEAFAIGLVDEVTPAGQLEVRTARIVEYVAGLSPVAAASVKRFFRSLAGDRRASDELQLNEFGRALTTAEARRSIDRLSERAATVKRVKAPGD
jgi:enoyl-CoA hydratase/carnithine racemase